MRVFRAGNVSCSLLHYQQIMQSLTNEWSKLTSIFQQSNNETPFWLLVKPPGHESQYQQGLIEVTRYQKFSFSYTKKDLSMKPRLGQLDRPAQDSESTGKKTKYIKQEIIHSGICAISLKLPIIVRKNCGLTLALSWLWSALSFALSSQVRSLIPLTAQFSSNKFIFCSNQSVVISIVYN